MKENVSLKEYSTYKIGGSARYFVEAKNKEEIVEAICKANEMNLPFYIISGGSNILFPDSGLNGVVIKISNQGFEIQNDLIEIQAGTPINLFLQKCMELDLTGAEFLSGIPGTIGGAINSNAGAFEKSMKDIVEEVLILNSDTSEIKILKKEDCDFSYRNSFFKKNPNLIILSAKIKLEKGEGVKEKIKNNFSIRKEKQPYEFPSAGSVFKNPKDNFAGKLIEEVGLKGFKINDAQVSEKHANFIVNLGNASADDVLKIIKIIKEKVKEKFNIELEEEIKIF